MDPDIQKGADLIRAASKILVFTGAGLSTESGIPDFRSPGGIWERYDPSDFYFDRILSDEKARINYWKMSAETYATMRDAQPNAAHLALKNLEDTGKLLSIVTQNIDALHHKAGNSAAKIIQVHGTAFTVSCLNCGKQYPRDEIEDRIKAGEAVPYCKACQGILKPDTISFGQAMPQDKMALAVKHAGECDLCIVLGSSLVVYPAAHVPATAAEAGAKLIIINRDRTALDPHAALVLHRTLGEVLPPMVTASLTLN